MGVDELKIADGAFHGDCFRCVVVRRSMMCKRHTCERHKSYNHGKRCHSLTLHSNPPTFDLQILPINLPENLQGVTYNMTNWKWKKLQINLDSAEKEQANWIVPHHKDRLAFATSCHSRRRDDSVRALWAC